MVVGGAETVPVGFNRRRASCLGFHNPTGNGGLAVVTGFVLQGDGAGSDVGDSQVGWRTRQFWRRAEEINPSRTWGKTLIGSGALI